MSFEDGVPVAYHDDLVDGSGQRIAVYQMLDEKCPVCNRKRVGLMHIASDLRTETACCLGCDWIQSRLHVQKPQPGVPARMNAHLWPGGVPPVGHDGTGGSGGQP